MSETKEVQTALSLEDLFLSHEFGRPRNGSAVAAGASALFRSAPLRGPLVPRAATSISGLVGHDSTSHLRRNRTFAAVSGVAAALLVAVGLVAHTGAPSTKGGTLAIGPGATSIGKGGTTITVQNPLGSPSTSLPVSTPVTGTGSNIGLADFTGGSGKHNVVGTAPVPVIVSPIPKGTGTATTGTGTTGQPVPAATAPGGALAPVVTLVGHAVTTVGNTATTLGSGLGVTLPVLSPVTNAVGSLGGGLSALGDSLSGTLI